MHPHLRRRFSLPAALVLALLGAAVPAHATDYWTPAKLLGEFFKTSQKVSPKSVTLSDADATQIAKQLGVDAAKLKKTWSVYVGEADGKRTGYAILDAEIGLHEPIDFGVRFDDKGTVSRMEIMAFREPYGDGVRADRFREQFVGKTAKDAITAGRDIDIVSGATLSSRSVALGVKRDVLVLQAALKNGL
jgi:Na+-translocating ferredoxin:NAD+ oxidoreductase RnfG subunit